MTVDHDGYEPDLDELYDDHGGRIWSDDDPLVRRLRSMKWNDMPAEIRERCWDQIERRLIEFERDGTFSRVGQRELSLNGYRLGRRLDIRAGSPT